MQIILNRLRTNYHFNYVFMNGRFIKTKKNTHYYFTCYFDFLIYDSSIVTSDSYTYFEPKHAPITDAALIVCLWGKFCKYVIPLQRTSLSGFRSPDKGIYVLSKLHTCIFPNLKLGMALFLTVIIDICSICT